MIWCAGLLPSASGDEVRCVGRRLRRSRGQAHEVSEARLISRFPQNTPHVGDRLPDLSGARSPVR